MSRTENKRIRLLGKLTRSPSSRDTSTVQSFAQGRRAGTHLARRVLNDSSAEDVPIPVPDSPVNAREWLRGFGVGITTTAAEENATEGT
jgi:hypothetical protein